MGSVGKWVGHGLGKVVGAITGSNQQAKAAEEQARMMNEQNQREAAAADQQKQIMQAQTVAAQQATEQTAQREQVMKKAEEQAKQAEIESQSSADVTVGKSANEAEGGRTGVRKKFQSRKGQTGLSI